MLGRKKCKILKEIRQKIADENDIPYVTHECRFQGECSGTCPRCESELRYLEKQLEARAAAGKRIAIAALCAGMGFGVTGCSPSFSAKAVETGTEVELSGEVAYVGDITESGYIEQTDDGSAAADGGATDGTTGNTAATNEAAATIEPEMVETTGEVAPPEYYETGRVVLPEDYKGFELTGDVAVDITAEETK